jgi:sugar phosphate isomerase/epimerase
MNEPHDLAPRLGLNVPREVWPTGRALAEMAGAGFRWVQLHSPPVLVLRDGVAVRRHARALRALLDPTGLRLVLHAPDALSAGTVAGDRALQGLLDHAAEAGAEIVAYHGLNCPDPGDGDAAAVRERASLEERSLSHLLQRAHQLGVRLAIENLAPVFPGDVRLAHDALAVRDLVRRLDTPAAGMLLDLGHLHIAAERQGREPGALAAACAGDVALIHAHDNLGMRRFDVEAPGLDPLRLDLHLAPGTGTVPWSRLAPVAGAGEAPVVLEVQPQHRPPLAALAAAGAALLAPPAERRLAA